MKLLLIPGITSYIAGLFISNSSSTTGAGLAGLEHDTGSLVARYKRQGQATWTLNSLSDGTLGTWSSGGFKEDVIAGGHYELGIPNAALAYGDGVEWVQVNIQGAANMAPLTLEIQLDNQSMLIKGLLGVNMVLDDFSYNLQKKATIGNIYIYDTPVNASAHVSGGGSGLILEVDGVAVVDPGGNTTKLTRTVA